MAELKCDMCGKESVGKGGHLYVEDAFTDRNEDGHLEGWHLLGPRCLNLMKSITDRNCAKADNFTGAK